MNRLLAGMIQVIQEVDTNNGMALCNEVTCPTMSAGRYAQFRLTMNTKSLISSAGSHTPGCECSFQNWVGHEV
jgi:hypothetical protein